MLPKPSQYEVAKKEPRSVPRNKVEASGCEAPTGVLVDPGKALVGSAAEPPPMSAEARNLSEELIKLVDKPQARRLKFLKILRIVI